MILDKDTQLSNAQALTATGYSTNTYDSGLAGREVGSGEELVLAITVDVAANAADGDETYQFQLVQSANDDLTSHDVLVQTDTGFVTRSTLTLGKKIFLPVPAGMKTKRYLGARYVLGGTTPSITVSANLIPRSHIQNEQVYADGITIS